MRRSAALAPVERARGPVNDLVPVSGHPQLLPGMTGIVRRGRPHAGPVRAPVSADADQVQGLHSLPNPGAGWCSSSTREGPCRRARSTQIRPTASVTETMPSVSVTTARYPGEAVAAAQTRKCPTPSRARPHAGYCQNGSSTSSPPSGARSSAEAGVSPSIAESLPAIAPCRTCSLHPAPLPGERPQYPGSTRTRDNRRTDGYRPAALQVAGARYRRTPRGCLATGRPRREVHRHSRARRAAGRRSGLPQPIPRC